MSLSPLHGIAITGLLSSTDSMDMCAACRYDSRAVSSFYKLLMSKSKEEVHAAAAALTDELKWLEVC